MKSDDTVTAPPGKVGSERLLLLALSAVQFTHILDFMIMMPLEPKLSRAFGINAGQFGMMVAAYSLSAGVLGIFAGMYLDRFDRKKALIFLYVGFLLGTLACALAPNHHTLLAARLIAGGFGGVAGSVVLAVVSEVIPPERRGRAMGMIMTAFSLATILGLPAGLFLADKLSWHAPFYLIVIAGLPVIFALKRYLPALPAMKGAAEESPWARMGAILKHHDHRRAFALVMGMTCSGAMVYPFMSASLVANAGVAENRLSLVYLLGGVATFFTSPLFGRWSDKYGKARLFLIMAPLSAIPTLFITHLDVTPLPWVLFATTMFMILTTGRYVPGMALITLAADPRHRSGFMSVNSAVQQLASGTATAIASLLVTKEAGHIYGYGRTGIISTVVIACCIPLVIALHRTLVARDKNLAA